MARRLLWVVAMGWEGFYGTPNKKLLEAALTSKCAGDLLGVELTTIGPGNPQIDVWCFGEGNSPSLRRSVRKASDYAKQMGCSEVLFYAHRLMVWRTRLLARKLVSNSTRVEVIPVSTNFYPLASQIWVRNSFLFVLREIPILLLELIGVPKGK